MSFDFKFNTAPSPNGRKAHFLPCPTEPYDISKRDMSYGEVLYHLGKHKGSVTLYFYGMNILDGYGSPKGAMFSLSGVFARDHVCRMVEENAKYADFYCFKSDERSIHVYAVKAQHAARIVGHLETPTEKPRTTQSEQGATPKNHANTALAEDTVDMSVVETPPQTYQEWLRAQYGTDEEWFEGFKEGIMYYASTGEHWLGRDFTKTEPFGDIDQQYFDDMVAMGNERRLKILGPKAYKKELEAQGVDTRPFAPTQEEIDKMPDEEQDRILERIAQGYYHPDSV